MARVFISHASQDGEYAVGLHRWLVGESHEVFLYRDLRDGIPIGEQWERRLHERLRWADAVVCVVTHAYPASTWCAADIRDPPAPHSIGYPHRPTLAHTGTVKSVAFSPDGHTLTTASKDQTARLWETNMDNVVARICSLTPTITKGEWDRYLPGLPYRPPCP